MRKLSSLGNTAFAFSAAEVLNRVAVLAAMLIPARHYGVAQFGRLGAAFALTGILIIITNFIPVASITRDLCQQAERRVAIMSNYLWQRFLVMLLSSALLAAAYYLAAPGEVPLVVLSYLYLYGAVTAASVRAGLIAQERFLASSLCSLSGSGLLLLGAYLPVRLGLSLEAMCAGLALSQALSLLVVLGLLAFRGYPSGEMLRQQVDWSCMWLELKRNTPLWLAMALIAGYNRSNAVLCQALRGDHETGLFTASFRIFEGFALGAVLYQQVTYPRLVRELGSEGRTGRYLESSARFMIVCGQMLAVLVMLGAFRLMGPLWGRGFQASGLTMQVLVWALSFNLSSYVLSHILVAEGRTWTLMRVTLVACCVNLPANLLLISRHGAPGAAAATIVTEAVVLLGLLVALRGYRRNLGFICAAARSSLCAGAVIAAGEAALPLGLKPIVVAPLGAILYLLGVWGLRALRREDLLDVFRRLVPERTMRPVGEEARLPLSAHEQ